MRRRYLMLAVLLAAFTLAAFTLTACQPADTAPRQGSVTSADGVPIAYTVAGDGAAVVLVHCWCGDRSLHAGALADLATDHRVLALDLAGHGQSGDQRTNYTMTAFAGDVLSVMDAEHIDRAVLVGHSMGGTVIMETARLARERVVGLVGIDNLHQVESLFTREQLDQFMAPMRADFAGFVPPVVQGMFPEGADSVQVAGVTNLLLQTDPAVGLDAFVHYFEFDMPMAARAYGGPLRLVNDPVYPVDADQWQDHGVQLEVTWLEGVRHFPMVTAPGHYLSALRQAVVGLEAAATVAD